MDVNELRALQAPLKKQYREQPETARVPARAEATLELDEVACRLRSWGGETKAGLHPATGGDGSVACSADMLLEALVAGDSRPANGHAQAVEKAATTCG